MPDLSSPDRPIHRWMIILAMFVVLTPYLLLVLLSLGSGWGFPTLIPERLDLLPWRRFFSDRDGMRDAALTSASMAVVVATLGTAGGLILGRTVSRTAGGIPRYVIYLPFVLSPIIVGIGLYDLLVRLSLTSSLKGSILVQLIFALSFSGVFFSEMWNPRIERLEALVKTLGGGRWAVWRHAIFPATSGLILVCIIQTALLSWLDYGLVSVIGGGRVRTVTVKLFSSLREANVNQAAQAALVLLAPTVVGFGVSLWVLRMRAPSSPEMPSD